MKQVLQSLSTGATEVVDAPCPTPSPGTLLIDTAVTLISAGTERMLVDFGRASYLDKARQQPEKVRMVLDKVATEGLLTTIDAVRSKLGQPLTLGYSNVGRVHAVGSGVEGFKPGDRVVSNGPHADVVRVPVNLCAKIPDSVSDDEAAFVVVASIGLQGIRLAKPTLGECFVVTGTGLIGLLTIQLLRAHGCRVLAIDFDFARLALAKQFGAEICNPGSGEDPVAVGLAFSRGVGVDGVVITASTKSSDPVMQAARMCRKRGRIILVGVAGLELNRADFYEKELNFQVSCSYGPGRYDSSYEERGNDYPIGFVRWTEQRNFIAVLDMLADGRLDVKPLITHRFEFERAADAYQLLTSEKATLGILLDYSLVTPNRHVRSISLKSSNSNFPKSEVSATKPVVGFVGAGNYSSRILVPAFKSAGALLHTISTSGGVSGVVHGRVTGFIQATTDTASMISNPEINTIVVVTRHDSHARFVISAIEANKHVFVEKPLAISHDELAMIEQAYSKDEKSARLHLMVGFNRRFSPQVKKMKALLQTVSEPKSFIMTVNAGAIPSSHWVQDNSVGGGRIIGEACHFIDLMRFLVGAKVVSLQARCIADQTASVITEDKASITLGFADGSFGSIHYLANGSSAFPKERIEVFAAGRVLQLDNFRKLKGYGWPGFKRMNLWRQDKGQKACAAAFVAAIESGGPAPIPINEIFEVARTSIEVAELLRQQ